MSDRNSAGLSFGSGLAVKVGEHNTGYRTGHLMDDSADTAFEKSFVPKGAMAFFIAVLLTMIAIWLSLYVVMLQRSVS